MLAFVRFVAGSRLVLAVTLGAKALLGDAAFHESAHDRVGPPLRQQLVRGLATRIVGVPLDLDLFDLGMIHKDLGDVVEQGVAGFANQRTSDSKLDAVVDDDLFFGDDDGSLGATVEGRLLVGLASFLGAGILVVADVVAVAVGRAAVFFGVLVGDTLGLGAGVAGVRNTVAVAVWRRRRAAVLGRILAGDTLDVCACIFVVGDAVAVRVSRRWATVLLGVRVGRAGKLRTGILGIGDGVAVAVDNGRRCVRLYLRDAYEYPAVDRVPVPVLVGAADVEDQVVPLFADNLDRLRAAATAPGGVADGSARALAGAHKERECGDG